MATLDTIANPLAGELGLAYDADITANVLGAEIDLLDVASVGWFFLCTTFTSGTLTLQVQVSDTSGSGYALDPSATYTINAGEVVDGTGVFQIGYSGAKRYAKLDVVVDTPVGIGGVAIAVKDKNVKS